MITDVPMFFAAIDDYLDSAAFADCIGLCARAGRRHVWHTPALKHEPVEGSAWSDDKKTCSIYVLLEPGRSYIKWIE